MVPLFGFTYTFKWQFKLRFAATEAFDAFCISLAGGSDWQFDLLVEIADLKLDEHAFLVNF